jgi:hypothetical protein
MPLREGSLPALRLVSWLLVDQAADDNTRESPARR